MHSQRVVGGYLFIFTGIWHGWLTNILQNWNEPENQRNLVALFGSSRLTRENGEFPQCRWGPKDGSDAEKNREWITILRQWDADHEYPAGSFLWSWTIPGPRPESWCQPVLSSQLALVPGVCRNYQLNKIINSTNKFHYLLNSKIKSISIIPHLTAILCLPINNFALPRLTPQKTHCENHLSDWEIADIRRCVCSPNIRGPNSFIFKFYQKSKATAELDYLYLFIRRNDYDIYN